MLSRIIFLATLCICLFPSSQVFAHADIHERLEQTSRLIAKTPQDPSLYIRRAFLYAEHDEWEKALADLDRAAAHSLHPDEVAFDRASILHQWYRHEGGKARLEAALRQVQRFLARHPDHADALLLRARLRRALGQPETALEDYARAIALTPHPRMALFMEQAELLQKAGRPQQALEVLDKARIRLGTAPLPLIRMAVGIAEEQGRPREALVWQGRLPEVLARLPNERLHRGDLLWASGRKREARQEWCKARSVLDAMPKSRRAQPAFAGLGQKLDERLAGVTCHPAMPHQPGAGKGEGG